jgi:hypothetical protein
MYVIIELEAVELMKNSFIDGMQERIFLLVSIQKLEAQQVLLVTLGEKEDKFSSP